MAIPFSPTRQDVERYRRLRAVGMELNHKIIKTFPRRVIEEVGDAIGIRHNGVLVFTTEDMSSVLMDCCLHDWFENGKNQVQRYSEAHPAQPGTDEGYLLSAYIRARYRVLVVQSAVPDAGVHCHDILNDEELFVMDLAMSRTLGRAGTSLAARTIPLGEYWMTSGAGLPVISQETVLDALSRIEGTEHALLKGPGSVALMMVRACLAVGAADRIRYESAEAKPSKHRLQPPRPKFKRRH
jgi:hypothetical protein